MEKTGGAFFAFLKSEKGGKVILATGILAILLIFISGYFSGGEKGTSQAKSEQTQLLSADEYTAQLERRLTDIVGSIAGAGTCKVMVTLENGIQYVYAQEEKISENKMQDNTDSTVRTQESGDRQKSYIIVDSGSGNQALVVTEVQPTIKGVVIVCQGGGSPSVQQQVINAVTTALAINSTKVCVAPLS